MNDDGFVPMGDTIRVRIEGDLVFVRNFRVLTMKDYNALVEVFTHVYQQHGQLFTLYDSTHSEGVEREVRKATTVEAHSTHRVNATAIFGASFAVRTLGNMLERALIGLGRRGTGMCFFETEAEARAYLEGERIRAKAKV